MKKSRKQVPSPMIRLDPVEIELLNLYAELDLSRLLERMAEKIKKLLLCEEASIFLYNPLREELYFEIATGERSTVLKQIVLKVGEGVAGWVAQHRQPLIISDCRNDPRFSNRSDEYTSFHTRSLLAVPVENEGRLIGILEGINKTKGEFDASDLKTLSVMTHYVSIPLQNALFFNRLKRESGDKDLLLRLARRITMAGRFEDIFELLRELIIAQTDAQSIRLVFERPDGVEQFDLLSTPQSVDAAHSKESFPFRSIRGLTGQLEIVSRHAVSDESRTLIMGLAGFTALLADKLALEAERIGHLKTEKELEIARSIQQSFLIAHPPKSPGAESCFFSLSSSRVGGDFYDMTVLSDHRLLFTVADIAGHGIPASLVMAVFRSLYSYRSRRDPHIDVSFSRINDLIAETTDPSQYLTAFCGSYDHQHRELTYINAGHPPAVLLRAGRSILLQSNALALGLFSGMNYELCRFPVEPGDLLFIYTDGVVETEDGKHNVLGLDRCVDILSASRADPVELIRNRLHRSLVDFHGNDRFEDDITFMLIRFT